MRVMRLAFSLLLTVVAASSAFAQARPDFSGSWKFNAVKSAQPGPDGKVVLAAMLGDEFTARQSAASLELAIRAGATKVEVIYKLDGSESRNVSPGPPGQPGIPVVSTAKWEGDRLVVTSSSTSNNAQGRPIQIVTKRMMWLDASGDLILERTGTPESEVVPSKSVYSKAAK